VLSKLTSDSAETLVVSLRVYDKYFAESSLTSTVSLSASSDLLGSMTKLLRDERVDEGSLSVVSGNLNTKDCSAAPKALCASLFRGKCFKYDNLCGACLTGYFGEDKGVSACLTQSELAGISDTSSRVAVSRPGASGSGSVTALCDTVTCAPWHHCEEGMGEAECVLDSKPCPGSGECSGHGACVFVSSSLEKLLSCGLGSTGCSAVCECQDGYAGDSCSYTSVVFAEKKSIRHESIVAFQSLMLTQDNSLVQIESNINQIVSLAQERAELNEAAALVVFELLESVMVAVLEISTSS
jgi:hypothetical protein